MATHSIITAWEIPCTEEPWQVQTMGLQEWDTTSRLNHHRGKEKLDSTEKHTEIVMQ